MRRPDPGAAETDRIIAEIERRIAREYWQAEREIKEKLDDYLRRFQIKDRTWQRWVAEGKKTEAEYKKWRTGQIAIGKRWEEMRDTISEDLLNTSKIAKSIATGYMPEVYALNHDYGTFQVEKGALVDTSYTLYSREAAERLFRENPKMLPAPGKKVSRAIAEKKAKRWNNKHIQSVMMQAILQGNSIPDIATRLANTVGDSDRKAAIRNARTMVTGAQNAGRVDSYKRANNMGIPVKKQWLATLDMRTRHEHRILDGQVKDQDKPFEVDGMKIMFPGDPDAPGGLVWNCFVGETEVATDSEIVRSYKHEFHGDLIRIRTSTGIDFTCTPNHPILTPSGWVPAARFNKGDNLLITRVGNSGGVTVNGNVYHVHSSIQAIHDSFHEFGIANNTPMANFNFHGDIPTSDVEVISKKRLLRIDGDTGIFKGFNKTFFKNADTLIFSKCHFVKCLRRIDVSTFGLMSRSRKFLSFFWRCLSHAKVHRFGTVTGSNISVSEYPINNLPATTVIRSELLNGLTGSVFLDNVIAVNKCSGSSTRHVYNLQTENGYYFVTKGVPQLEQKSNDNYGVIVKNCRCTLIPAIDGYVSDLSDTSLRHSDRLGGMSYEEWKAEKESSSNPITLPEEKADNIRASYIREYRGYGGYVKSGRDTTLDIDARKKRKK